MIDPSELDPETARLKEDTEPAEEPTAALGIELAWGLIANAYGGEWNHATAEWKAAAEKWRDTYCGTWSAGENDTVEEPAEVSGQEVS